MEILPGETKEVYIDMQYSLHFPFIVFDNNTGTAIQFTLQEAVALAAIITKAVVEQQARIEKLQEGNMRLQDQEEVEAYHAIIDEWQDMKQKNNKP